MPKSTRDWAKRKIQEAQKHINWVGYHLSQIMNVYQEKHPEIAEPIKEILLLQEMIDNIVIKINDKI